MKNQKKKKQLPELRSVKMLWIMRFSTLFILATLIILCSTSLHSFSPPHFSYRKSPVHRNAPDCTTSLIHVSITLDTQYLRGSIAAVHSILHNSKCPENIFFHFILTSDYTNLKTIIQYIFPDLKFKLYYFNPEKVKKLISNSVRTALEQPLNYARNYLADLLQSSIHKVIYLDSDLILVDDIFKLWSVNLGEKVIGAPEYCHTNFSTYFAEYFWTEYKFSSVFSDREPCYFNTGVMVMDLKKWRRIGYTKLVEKWMEVQKRERIYELGSLPPFLLVFAGHVAAIDHRWNQHGLGGDNVKGSCRELHPGEVSLLHWSGSGKPWVRLDAKKPCPVDLLWAPYDLYEHPM